MCRCWRNTEAVREEMGRGLSAFAKVDRFARAKDSGASLLANKTLSRQGLHHHATGVQQRGKGLCSCHSLSLPLRPSLCAFVKAPNYLGLWRSSGGGGMTATWKRMRDTCRAMCAEPRTRRAYFPQMQDPGQSNLGATENIVSQPRPQNSASLKLIQ